ncbi:methyltransferase-like protein 9 [Acanthaster planci]|uniref:Methyltransferase-like protein 9 n=1 Tax=Acanthaster planci TaxID=133434 RepID=A0A8B7XI47_ACAPL|nr:methyltransferase-like protein 9 [Acanthaster planci]XP_022080466.1 methyltransferase-like protein 9 [Acanthaster planci]XP_022080467.1 methyltransferase-like protein 9 [Acanthaster planci]XP_022080468.1 methyltransferase-like protein 9 [Acanthaster planci]XP_022080469.1 methyltransferase-like protein 9 [Acanthaster planci]
MTQQPRPYIRNPMLRMAYEHQTNTKFTRNKIRQHFDVEKWYKCNLDIFPEDLRVMFHQSHMDRATEKFLDISYRKSDWIITQAWHSLAKAFLGFFMSTTSINGLLDRGSMFVFSKEQFRSLLEIDADFKADHLLDLGAGDGKVTEIMASHFRRVSATEVSYTMQRRLRQLGYTILGLEQWAGHKYDVISCLNLLDRCERPATIMKDIHRSLAPGGVTIVAMVLPFKPFVETGSNQNQPIEELHLQGNTWEEQARSFILDFFTPAEFTVLAFTKLPYLCEGDTENPFYVLQDAVFVLRRSADAGMALPWASCESGADDSDVVVDITS